MAAPTNSTAPMVLSVAERSGVWGVKLNGRFYGDYVKREWAKQAALEQARRLRLAGNSARAEIADDKGNVTVIKDEE
jgi:hypothetical protein